MDAMIWEYGDDAVAEALWWKVRDIRDGWAFEQLARISAEIDILAGGTGESL